MPSDRIKKQNMQASICGKECY